MALYAANEEKMLCKAVQSNQLTFMCLGVIILRMIVCTAIHNVLVFRYSFLRMT